MTLTDAWLWVRNSSSVSVFPDIHIFFSINFLLPQTWLLYLSAIITAILIVSYQQINKALNYPQAFVFKSFRLNSPVLTSLFHENTGDSVDFEEMVPIRFISREKHVFLVGFSLAFLKFPFQESKKWLTSLYLYYQEWNEIFPEKSRCCSYLVIYKEGIALQFKLVIREIINISSMEESTSKWEKFRRHKRKTIITPYKIETKWATNNFNQNVWVHVFRYRLPCVQGSLDTGVAQKIKSNQQANKRRGQVCCPHHEENDCLVVYLPKKKPGKISRNVFYFLHVRDSNICSPEITSKSINQWDGKWMKLQWKSFFFQLSKDV